VDSPGRNSPSRASASSSVMRTGTREPPGHPRFYMTKKLS
jgi:hypothetical protein